MGLPARTTTPLSDVKLEALMISRLIRSVHISLQRNHSQEHQEGPPKQEGHLAENRTPPRHPGGPLIAWELVH